MQKTDGSTLECSVMLKLINKISDCNSSYDNNILGKFSQNKRTAE